MGLIRGRGISHNWRGARRYEGSPLPAFQPTLNRHRRNIDASPPKGSLCLVKSHGGYGNILQPVRREFARGAQIHCLGDVKKAVFCHEICAQATISRNSDVPNYLVL